MSTKIQTASLREIIEESFESTEPQNTILDFLKKREGKRINTKHLEELQKLINDHVVLYKDDYSCYLEWGRYRANQGKTGGEILLARHGVNVIIDTQFIQEANVRYFSALEIRNERRKKLLSPEYENKLFVLEAFIKQFKHIESQIYDIICEETFDPVAYRIRELFER